MHIDHNNEGGVLPPPRFELLRTNFRCYELWISDRIATFDSKADAQKWADLLRTHSVPTPTAEP